MFKVKFEVGGLGYDGVSYGGMHIYVIRNDYLKKFHSRCQGTSWSGINTEEIQVKNSLDGYDTSVLLDLNLFDLKLEIPTAFGCYNPVEFTLSLYESGSMDPVFEATRRPMAWGYSIGDLSVLLQAGQMKCVYKGSYSKYKQSVAAYDAKQLKDNVRRDMNAGAMY